MGICWADEAPTSKADGGRTRELGRDASDKLLERLSNGDEFSWRFDRILCMVFFSHGGGD